jgi:sugar lactone lactonase YvrE
MRKSAALLSLCVLTLLCLAGCGSGTSASSGSASLAANPGSLAFTATLGQAGTTQTVTLTNSGSAAATLQAATLTGANASDFTISSDGCSAGSSLGPSAFCLISVAFQPTAAGSRSATLSIPTSAGTQTVSLTGTGDTVADVSITPALTFPSIPINQTSPTQTITVSNTGGTPATIAAPTLSGANTVDFTISSTTCTTSLTTNSTCNIDISFTPTATGTRSATLSLSESSLGAAKTLTAALTGTGGAANLGLQGTVVSGSQPIENASVQLYAAGAAGNGSAARTMLSTPVTTNAAGNFYLATGSPLALTFTCANPTDQIYAVATAGNPGLMPASTSNASLIMITALGNCGALSTTSSITINELTTAAAAWTLAPFTASATSIGASATNHAGIANAFLDAQLLANSATGEPAVLASNLAVEPGKLEALANALTSCVDSDGTTACSPLFTAATPTGGAAPNNTFSAALNIVKNPGENVAAVYDLIPATPVYATSLAQAPNDWTITLAISGSGLKPPSTGGGSGNGPTALAIDSYGNVWVASYYGALSAFSPQGTQLTSAGYGVGTLFESQSLTIDSNGNIWVSNQQSAGVNAAGSVTKFVPTSAGAITSTHTYFDASIDFPDALSADTNGDIFIANYASSAVTAYTSTGAPLASHGTALGSGDAAGPVALAADAAHGVWIANSQSSTVTHVSSAGAIVSNLPCCAGANGSNGIATDSADNAWITDFGANAFSVIASTPSGDSISIDESPILGAGYVSGPAGVSVDAAQNVWIANYRGESISELAGIHSTAALGTALSPPTGYGYPATSTATPRVLAPEAIVPDASGNLWVTNNGNNNLIVFFGLATPTKTPVQPAPVAP